MVRTETAFVVSSKPWGQPSQMLTLRGLMLWPALHCKCLQGIAVHLPVHLRFDLFSFFLDVTSCENGVFINVTSTVVTKGLVNFDFQICFFSQP